MNNGVITPAELKSFFQEVGEDIPQDELQQIIDSLY